jgi:hypothetical protein
MGHRGGEHRSEGPDIKQPVIGRRKASQANAETPKPATPATKAEAITAGYKARERQESLQREKEWEDELTRQTVMPKGGPGVDPRKSQ